MLFVKLEPDFEHKDQRGSLVQLIRDGYNQVNYITSLSGTVRGGHYHKHNKELYYIIKGSMDVLLEKDGEKQQFKFIKGDMFYIPPYVKHTFTYLEDSALITMYDLGVEEGDGQMDMYN